MTVTVSESSRRYYLKNRAKRIRYAKDYARAHPKKAAEWQRRTMFKRRYGITVAEYDARVAAQEGRCKICRVLPGTGPRQCLVVDHDHKTKFVRGLLCQECNLALGAMRDSPLFLRRAANYLEGNGSNAL